MKTKELRDRLTRITVDQINTQQHSQTLQALRELLQKLDQLESDQQVETATLRQQLQRHHRMMVVAILSVLVVGLGLGGWNLQLSRQVQRTNGA